MAWRYKGEPWFDGSRWHERYELTADERLAKWKDKDALPLYAAPQPASGWLTAEEREAVAFAAKKLSELSNRQYVNGDQDAARDTTREEYFLRALLARSSPPEVVLPRECGGLRYGSFVAGWNGYRDEALKALAVAGVKVKEVGK